ncbi:MAG: hypothetical protein KAG95_04060 [Bacteroidales bacterium]|nr:hypothetical protein [Bacteroidales bacterium]
MSIYPKLIAQNTLKKINSEKINLFTDRNLYISGEDLNFSAIIYSNDSDIIQTSKVIYVDIITDGDKKISQNKFLISDGQINGTFSIPKNCITGYYYLRAYTKIMRNYSHAKFAYVLLKIINPNKRKVLHPKNIFEAQLDSSSHILSEKESKISIITNKKVYNLRDTIHLTIQNTPELQKLKGFTISVVPKFSLNESIVKIPSHFIPSKKYFKPETSGISISGQLIDKKTKLPLVYNSLYVSQVDDKNMITGQTDSIGRFNFYLRNQYGKKKIVFTAEVKNIETEPVFLIDNGFEKVPKDISFPVFKMSQQERETAYKMALNKQLKDIYYPKTSNKEDTINSQPAFYASPSHIVYFKDYISLNAISEYFTEIELPVKIIKNNKKREFRVRGTQSELFIYKPLLMIDWVVVKNAEDILALSPQSISSVEIINSPYLRGDFIFGGIINFISKNNDFGGIEFRSSTIAIEYDLLSKLEQQSLIKSVSKRNPDVRNTLFWKSFIGNHKQKTTKFDIIAGDTPENYLIILKGIDKNGNEIKSKAEFEVK